METDVDAGCVLAGGDGAGLLAQFGTWLDRERGLSPVSVRYYSKQAKYFLAVIGGPKAVSALDAGKVTISRAVPGELEYGFASFLSYGSGGPAREHRYVRHTQVPCAVFQTRKVGAVASDPQRAYIRTIAVPAQNQVAARDTA